MERKEKTAHFPRMGMMKWEVFDRGEDDDSRAADETEKEHEWRVDGIEK